MSDQQAPKRPRHLMDPNNPRRETIKPTGAGVMGLEPVQKWVLSVLAATTIGHMALGLLIAAFYVDDSRTDAQIGLCVLASAFGVLTVLVFRAIHQHRTLSPWLLLGLLPGPLGIWMLFG